MAKVAALIFGASLALAVTVSVLCAVLLPTRSTEAGSKYRYEAKEGGRLVWIDRKTGREKLQLVSATLAQANGQITAAAGDGCNEATLAVEPVDRFPDGNTECWTVTSCRKETSAAPALEDCFSMKTESSEIVHWFGGAEMIAQRWPLNSVRLENGAPFLTSDLPSRYGNVLERYYLSSLGSAIFVEADVPLHVAVFSDEKLCLSAKYEGGRIVGPGFLRDGNSSGVRLSYAVCMDENSKSVHQSMTDAQRGYIPRPAGLPDLKMMQDPIWSTWARFKSDINETVVKQFAEDILSHNFTNCQLEIDDGYETSYGDFAFDIGKFPSAQNMVEKLHDLGFRVTIWVTPFINLDSSNYLYARTRRYFVPDSDDGSPAVIRWWNGRGSTVDYTNPEASAWYLSILESTKNRYRIDSFKFDAGETSYLPKAGLNYTATRYSNPGEYTRVYAETAFKAGGPMMEMRSSWRTQSGQFYMRLMDKGSTWGWLRGFRTVIPSALTFGIIGYPFVLPDMIGGNAYGVGDNMPERELYIRWIELSAFLPCMQFSISPWQYDGEVTEIARRYVDLHRTVVYDEVTAAAQRYVSGELSLPVAPVWFHASADDASAFAIDDEFMVGDRYLVAPILEKGATGRDIYLPGESKNLWLDRMRSECGESSGNANCTVPGGTWLRSYRIALDQISWWEKVK